MTKKRIRNTSPLCFLPDGRLVCYQHGDVVILANDKEIKRYHLFNSAKESILGRCKHTNRLLRLGIRAAIAIDEVTVLLSIGNMLYELNSSTGKLSNGFFCGEGIRPLQFSEVKNINGFNNGLYFGGYVHNPDKNPVNIYHRIDIDKWEVVYTFPKGAINHVHNVITDPYRNCLWVFTGDFDEAAAIWKVSDNFKNVKRIAGGDQRWRGSVAFVLPEGLLYATDTPRADNYLYLFNPNNMDLNEVSPLSGSCIYGCQWKNQYVLATTVESEGGETSFFKKYFGRKRGAGIKDEYVHMYCGNFKDGFQEIYKEMKDRLPFTLFQFGAFKFPTGMNNSDTLYFQPVATVNNDLRLMAYTL